MKKTLTILLIIICSLGAIGQTFEYKVEWCISSMIQVPCPDANKKDKYGREINKGYSCLVYHFQTEYDCDHVKQFSDREEAMKFYERILGEVPTVELLDEGICRVTFDSIETHDLIKVIDDIEKDTLSEPSISTGWLGDAGVGIGVYKDIEISFHTGINDSGCLGLWNTSPTHFIEISNKKGETVLAMDSTFTITSYKGEKIITLSDLMEYEEECYNDSTEAAYDYYKWGNDTTIQSPSIDPGHIMGYIGRKNIYIHKQPTFAGFIIWLKTKYKID
jgi:hypothetical protein